jgi:hypothetical protein
MTDDVIGRATSGRMVVGATVGAAVIGVVRATRPAVDEGGGAGGGGTAAALMYGGKGDAGTDRTATGAMSGTTNTHTIAERCTAIETGRLLANMGELLSGAALLPCLDTRAFGWVRIDVGLAAPDRQTRRRLGRVFRPGDPTRFARVR